MNVPVLHIACTKKIKASLKKEAWLRNIHIQDKNLFSIHSSVSEKVTHYLHDPNYSFVFTSSNSLKSISNYAKKNAIQLMQPCYTTSGITLDVAVQKKMNVRAHAKNATLLAEEIIKYKPGKLVHFTTSNHRKELYTVLQQHHIPCKTEVVYERMIQPQKFSLHQAILFFSPGQVDAFLQCNEFKADTPAFCIGDTTAKQAIAKGYKTIISSTQPTQQELLNQLFTFYKR